MTNKIVIGTFYVWATGLSCLAVWGIGFAIFNLVTGNYGSTLSFEF